jgi:hypothetical protein
MRFGPPVCNSTFSTNEFTEILYVTLSAPVKKSISTLRKWSIKHDEKQLKRVLRDGLMADEPVEGVTVDRGDVAGVR